MGFGRNPHVPRAQAAEQKALDAPDDASRARAYREAAHQWDRAAEREAPGKRRLEYERNAARNRELADGGGAVDGPDPADEAGASSADEGPPLDPRLLN
ncbi:MAG: hypothetical protein IT372_37870 [Polyangiaceae bacterium]|nr:hypothetical protein [Polyangiaceae bacterium]